jgi:hypothetical protein
MSANCVQVINNQVFMQQKVFSVSFPAFLQLQGSEIFMKKFQLVFGSVAFCKKLVLYLIC